MKLGEVCTGDCDYLCLSLFSNLPSDTYRFSLGSHLYICVLYSFWSVHLSYCLLAYLGNLFLSINLCTIQLNPFMLTLITIVKNKYYLQDCVYADY
jgi:hypothetical protein